VHTKFNRPDIILHGPNAQVSYMEIVCISLTVRSLILFVVLSVLILRQFTFILGLLNISNFGTMDFIYVSFCVG
jgi:hypothetical protein